MNWTDAPDEQRSMENFTAGLLGVTKEAQVQQLPIFIPRDATAYDVFDFLRAVGPVKHMEFFPDGIDVYVTIRPVDQSRLLPKATEKGFTIGGHAQRPQKVGVVDNISPEELMQRSARDITAWLADHDLGTEEVEALLAIELARERPRSTVVKALTGGA